MLRRRRLAVLFCTVLRTTGLPRWSATARRRA